MFKLVVGILRRELKLNDKSVDLVEEYNDWLLRSDSFLYETVHIKGNSFHAVHH